MKNNVLALAILLLAAAVLWGQRGHPAAYPAQEVKAIFPREISPGVYSQVSPPELQQAARDGWQLVSVTPFVYRNEERGEATPKAIVTQTYPAYFFRRAKVDR